MKLLSFILILLFSSSIYSADYKLTKSEFLKKFEDGSIKLERTPMISGVQPEVLQRLVESNKKKYPSFKDQMFYVGYIESNKYRYFIFYEWFDRGCMFGSTVIGMFKDVKDDETAGKMAKEENKTYEKIDTKYCEKVLGIDIPSEKGLIAIPERVIEAIKGKKE